MKKTYLAVICALLGNTIVAAPFISVVKVPEILQTNSFYLGNRTPLLPAYLVALPAGTVQPRGCPIEIIATGKRIPQWTLDQYELAATLQQSPVASAESLEKVTLIPMGAARLRISSLPVVISTSKGHEWTAIK